MKIAITTKENTIFGHFGSCESFTLAEIEEGAVKSKHLIGTEGNHHGTLPGYLASLGVDVVISGGMGDGARAKLTQLGIEVITGVEGTIDEIIQQYAAGALLSMPQSRKGHSCQCGCQHE